jgi:MSHA biogenesis protein MshJ
MAKPDFKKFVVAIESRKKEERLVLLGAMLLVIAYGWLVLVLDPINAGQDEDSRRITVLQAQVLEEANRFVDIQRNYTDDPNTFARNRQQELQRQTLEVDEQLRELYGQLIQPREMAEVLTTILQRETTLKLVNLENQSASVMGGASAGAVVPLVGETTVGTQEGLDIDEGILVYRHGLSMVFEGDFIETIRYLRSLENLETSFFWQSMIYEVVEWPKARITLNIFTLSTQEDWIGV